VSFNPRLPHSQGLGGLTPAFGAQTIDFATLTSAVSKGKLLDAVRVAHGMWRQQALFRNILITGPTAFGPPGCLFGPDLDPFIRTAPGVAADQGPAKDLRDAVAKGVSTSFASWQQSVSVPGLAWYPTFAAVAAPVAPPTPNAPTPLSLCASTAALLGQQLLKMQIVAALPTALNVPQVDTFVGQLAQSLAAYFSTWISMQPVVGVMGQGPVPTYSPPAVLVGSVVGGSVIPAPGPLASGGQPPMIAV
jgi:hypothetical protein